ncbi:hypothetical protein K227x_17990 [Rubripirellula lacrimiformis]|uniref:Uncharacterized protein n=1 Tax=Rubripirellula lacrimiformis TaxID=1930273 RepID=A0A517N8F5_9BACT|nr:hypothetical protein [Rubripirellula lacrimiformis]QDT03417.1 hypothetical protein K227x_17990 [Rubripirellula lacrimiformis]
MKHRQSIESTIYLVVVALAVIILGGGCSFFPETRQRDSIHNPFPQLKRVAVLPFYNQSSEPTVDTDLVAEKYYAALQSVPGFEVLPIGVAKTQWLRYAMTYGEPTSGEDFQRLAQMMGVEALVVGSVTDFDAFYPPRMAMTVHWYAANEGFHTIPAGYGLPWGTEAEKQIPRRIAREAEFELARSQLATQTPLPPIPNAPSDTDSPNLGGPAASANAAPSDVGSAPGDISPGQVSPSRIPTSRIPTSRIPTEAIPSGLVTQTSGQLVDSGEVIDEGEYVIDGQPIGGHTIDTHTIDSGTIVEGEVYQGEFYGSDGGVVEWSDMDAPLPPAWPNPTDLIPDPPSPVRPVAIASHDPVLTHTKIYRGDDPYFTNRLADYVETGDDARSSGWQGYLKRSDDFIQFCCHLHITEMLESRGGKDESDLILRWPLSRY